jgi:hypothetical protein
MQDLQADFLKEIVALVVHQDEGGEVNDTDFPHGFHAQFGILDALDALDALL